MMSVLTMKKRGGSLRCIRFIFEYFYFNFSTLIRIISVNISKSNKIIKSIPFS